MRQIAGGFLAGILICLLIIGGALVEDGRAVASTQSFQAYPVCVTNTPNGEGPKPTKTPTQPYSEVVTATPTETQPNSEVVTATPTLTPPDIGGGATFTPTFTPSPTRRL